MRIASRALGRFLWAAFGSARILAPEAARAAESPVVVAVDCPALGAEQRAALESRANAELLVRQESGTLVVVCEKGRAQLSWHSSKGTSPRTSVPLAADERVTVDRVLGEFDRLLNEAADAPSSAEDDVGGLASAPSAPPVTKPLPATASDPGVVLSPPPSIPKEREDASGSIGVSAGAALELWSSSVAGALGPNVRVEVALQSHWVLDVGGSVRWTLLAPDGVSGSLVRLHAGVIYVLDDARRFRIGALGLVDVLRATPEASLHTASVNHTVLGAGLHVDYVLLDAPFRVVTGPTLSGRLGAVRVEFGDQQVFSIPAVAVGWSVEGLFGPL